jgi:acylphosphatase
MHSVKGYVSGRVQGVGFRYFVRLAAQRRGLCGYAHNLADGRVEFLLQGNADAVAQVIELIRAGPSHARVDALKLDAAQDLAGYEGFVNR